MQPIAQISTAFPYVGKPTNNSGALYHLVETYSVNLIPKYYSYVFYFIHYYIDLANPKSHILRTPFFERSRFSGLKSR